MSILIVCRLNQIRSPFLEQYLSQLFPSQRFESCGIKVLAGSKPTSRLLEIATNFGFEFTSRDCVKFEPRHVAKYSKILAVDEPTFKFVSESLDSVTYSKNTELVNLANFASFRELIPRDPFINEQSHIQIELLKLISAYINYTLKDTFLNFVTVIPRNEGNVESAYEYAKSIARQNNLDLIDLNTASKSFAQVSHNSNIREILENLHGFHELPDFLNVTIP